PSRSAEERTARTLLGASTIRAWTASIASAADAASGSRRNPSLTSRASRRASPSSSSSVPATRAAAVATPDASSWTRYASAARQIPSGTGIPAWRSRASVAAFGPTRSASIAVGSPSRTARGGRSPTGDNDEPQDGVGGALVLLERRRHPLERIRRGDQLLDGDRATGHEVDRGRNVVGREGTGAVDRQLLEVERERRELG